MECLKSYLEEGWELLIFWCEQKKSRCIFRLKKQSAEYLLGENEDGGTVHVIIWICSLSLEGHQENVIYSSEEGNCVGGEQRKVKLSQKLETSWVLIACMIVKPHNSNGTWIHDPGE